jgi:hypothetical protein
VVALKHEKQSLEECRNDLPVVILKIRRNNLHPQCADVHAAVLNPQLQVNTDLLRYVNAASIMT